MMKKKPPAKYIGRYKYQKVDIATGEVIETSEFDEFQTVLPVEERTNQRGNNFAILYLLEFYAVLEQLGGKKMAVMKYIVQNMDYTNRLDETEAQIAKGANVSLRTVKSTIKIMKDANIIAQKPGRIILNPKLINRKNANGEHNILMKFKALKGADPYTMEGTQIKNKRKQPPETADSPEK